MSQGPMRILVCGGRDYNDFGAVNYVLATIHARRGISCIIEGGATGADALARKWALMAGVPCETYEANWEKYGKRAGPMRNARMLHEGNPTGVVAFPGGKGTADMIAQAEKAGLKPYQYKPKEPT